jgi:outer membrane biogenesis lipoprotein LolB
MAILSKNPEKESEKQRQQEEAANAQAWAEWNASPQGRARAAAEAGQQLFEITIPISVTERTARGQLTGSKQDQVTRKAEARTVLEAIEAEGWHLEHVGYVFEQTGSVSRDKLLSSGQTAAVQGQIVGIYLFRAKTS